jgi:hypothetical protein
MNDLNKLFSPIMDANPNLRLRLTAILLIVANDEDNLHQISYWLNHERFGDEAILIANRLRAEVKRLL